MGAQLYHFYAAITDIKDMWTNTDFLKSGSGWDEMIKSMGNYSDVLDSFNKDADVNESGEWYMKTFGYAKHILKMHEESEHLLDSLKNSLGARKAIIEFGKVSEFVVQYFVVTLRTINWALWVLF